MAETTHISWCTSTWNPWIGCTKVSPGCAHCYAEVWSARYGRAKWGPGQPRQRTAPSTWAQVRRWDRKAARDGTTPRVFCGSLCDWLDPEVPVEWLADLLSLIAQTPHLTWMLLTKRPELWWARIGACAAVASAPAIAWCDYGNPPPNVAIGTTCEDQARADERIPHLLAIPATRRFISAEPLLERIDLAYACFNGADSFGTMEGINQVIIGGESGPHARPCDLGWIRRVRDDAQAAGVPVWVKQVGARPVVTEPVWVDGWATGESRLARLPLRHRNGADPSEWPADLRISWMRSTKRYHTAAGSTLMLTGPHGGIAEVSFDWVEEGACCDCTPEPYPVDGRLVWTCETCGGGGSAQWFEDEAATPGGE